MLKYTRGLPRSLVVNSVSNFANHVHSRATISCTGLSSILRPQHWRFRSAFCSRRHVSTYLRQPRAKVSPGKLSDHTHSPQAKGQAKGQAEEQEIMQVTRKSFEVQRPKIIERLRRSMFVSFDLEFSGIGKARDGSKQPSNRSRGNQSLQECYTNLREAVETYQVLQVGLCPVEWSEERSEC